MFYGSERSFAEELKLNNSDRKRACQETNTPFFLLISVVVFFIIHHVIEFQFQIYQFLFP